MSLWSHASALAAKTPPARNRYVDFLRAVSIGAVVFGHWLAAAPYVDSGGKLVATHMLAVSPWTQGLTWVIQVMPVFFIVGGYAHGISWRSAQAARRSYAEWLDGRLRRLIGPVLVVVGAWALLAALARAIDLPEVLARKGSQMALIPIWFLAVYVLVALLVPLTHAAWQRFGMASFFAPAAAAALTDAAFFGAGLDGPAWLNYLFVWSAVHQLGYAWLDGRFDRPRVALAWALAGLALLVGLIWSGPYPVSMVGVPGDAISNTTPPKVTLIALGCLQGGLFLALQGPLRRWLQRSAPWTATVLVNGMIMTVYLWHMTAMVLFLGLVHALGDPGLGVEPGTREWWITRPIWLGLLAVALLPFALVFSRFERPKDSGARPPAAWRQVAGALLVCAGLAQLALAGIAAADGIGVRIAWVAAILAGAALAGYWRRARYEVAAE
jgi:peptidoglycan/LPS O-acetylase OafA/YrhL